MGYDERKKGVVYPVPMEQAQDFIEDNIGHISSAKELARLMGYSRSYLTIRISELYDAPPGELIRNIRFEKVEQFIRRYPYETSNSIAQRAGLKNDKALYKFLSYHWDTNFTDLRRRILNGSDPG